MKRIWRYIIAIVLCILMIALLHLLIRMSINDEKFAAGDIRLTSEQAEDKPPVQFVKTKAIRKEISITSKGEVLYTVIFKVPERTDELNWIIGKDQWQLLNIDDYTLVVYRALESGDIELLNFDVLK